MPSTFTTMCALGLALTVGTVDVHRQAAAEKATPIVDMASLLRALPGDGVGAPSASATPPTEGLGLPRSVQVTTLVGTVYLPRGFRAHDGAFDLVVHFHGTPPTVEASVDRAKLDAAFLIVNLGIGSGAYENTYDAPGYFDRAIEIAKTAVEKNAGVESPRIRRLALSAWSAGYGAVARLLGHADIADRVDAVLLADGMHAGYVDERAHIIADAKMAPFVSFAQRAAQGDRLMGVTHSSIRTSGYASTTETAHYLVQHAGAEELASHQTGPRGMVMTTTADKANLHVRGFEGEDKAAHCDHLFGIGETLFPMLRDRWAR
jgi:hypothetical protein